MNKEDGQCANNELGAYLRKQRHKSEFTLLELVEKSGISKGMMGYMETGERTASVGMLAKYAVAVGITDISHIIRLHTEFIVREAINELIELEKQEGVVEKNAHEKKLLKDWLDQSYSPQADYLKLSEQLADMKTLVSKVSSVASELEDSIDISLRKHSLNPPTTT